MDFTHTEEQELLIESLNEWLDRYMTEEQVKEWYYGDPHGVPVDFTKQWIDDGFGLLGIPEEYGGTPVDNTTLTMVMEELHRRSCCILPTSGTMLNIMDLCHFGSDEQIKMFMESYRETGQCPYSLAISEPGAGSDNMAMRTYTKKQEDGTYVMNGAKTWVTCGEEAAWTMVIAKDEDPETRKDFSLWIMPMDTPGVSTGHLEKLGALAQGSFCDVYFDNVVLTEENRIGHPGKGFIDLMKNFEFERCVLVACSLGIAQGAMDDAAAYVSQRETFGKPIASHQLIQEKLVDMEIKLQNTRNMLYKTIWKIENGMDVRIDTALLKRYGATACHEVCFEALQIYAGLGFTKETRMHRAWNDTRVNLIGGGTNEIMVHIAGRQIAKKYAR